MTEAGFLGVTRSLGGKRWRTRGEDDRLALALSQRFDLPEAVGRVMAARGISLEDASGFLKPVALPDQIPSKIPSKMSQKFAKNGENPQKLVEYG